MNRKVVFAFLAILVAIGLYLASPKGEDRSAQEQSVSPVVTEKGSETELPGEKRTQEKETEKQPEAPGFRVTSERAWASIPTLEELRKLPTEDVHHTPRSLQEAGLALGDLAQLIHDKPEYRREGFQFYRKCASEGSFPMSIRAVCLKGYRKTGKDLGEALHEEEIPPQIRALTNQIDH